MALRGGADLFFDKGYGLFSQAMEATAAEGGPRLRKRALMIEGEKKCYVDDYAEQSEPEQVDLWPDEESCWSSD